MILLKVASTGRVSVHTATICALSSIWVIYATRHFYFFEDDFLNFVIARDMGFSWSYLTRDLFGQFVPLHRLGNLLYIGTCGLYFWPYRLMLVGATSGAIILASGISKRWNVSLAVAVPSIALLAFSPIYLNTYQWWSAALSVLPSGLLSLGAIALAATTARFNYWRHVAVASCFLFGLMFYPKGLFSLVLIFAVRVFTRVESQGNPLSVSILGALRDTWLMFCIAAAYLAIVTLGHYSSHTPAPDAATLAKFVWTGWNQGFLAGISGFHLVEPLSVGVANFCFLLIVVSAALSNKRTAILWLGFFVYFVLSLGVIGRNRAVVFGVGAATIGHYYTDILMYFVAFLFLSYGAPKPLFEDRPSPLAYGIVLMLSGAAVSHFLFASARVPHAWYAGPAKPAAFVANVRASLAQAGERAKIADGAVPFYVMSGWTAPLNQYRFILPLFPGHPQVVPVDQADFAFSEDGRLVTRR